MLACQTLRWNLLSSQRLVSPFYRSSPSSLAHVPHPLRPANQEAKGARTGACHPPLVLAPFRYCPCAGGQGQANQASTSDRRHRRPLVRRTWPRLARSATQEDQGHDQGHQEGEGKGGGCDGPGRLLSCSCGVGRQETSYCCHCCGGREAKEGRFFSQAQRVARGRVERRRRRRGHGRRQGEEEEAQARRRAAQDGQAL